jgi:hypothetical protein
VVQALVNKSVIAIPIRNAQLPRKSLFRRTTHLADTDQNLKLNQPSLISQQQRLRTIVSNEQASNIEKTDLPPLNITDQLLRPPYQLIMTALRNNRIPVNKVTKASRPNSPTMLYLDTYIKPFVDPDTYSKYQPIIARLGTRGHKDPQYRVESHARLEKLVQGDEEMKELHNECAKVHNKRFEGKNPRFHLPVFGEVGEKAESGAGRDSEMLDAPHENMDDIPGRGLETPHPPIVADMSPSAADKVAVAVEEINQMIILPTTERDRLPSNTSAMSYLAWLQQRKVRFPKVHPHYAECIALGNRFGRAPRLVYDEVLFHWGLETDSKFGEWHRKHRLEILGEDPLFGED